jgi:hypothetical protein
VVGTTQYAYDNAGNTTSITLTNSSSTTLSSYAYQYDQANRVTSENWSSGVSYGSHSYAYDAANQLLSADSTTYTTATSSKKRWVPASKRGTTATIALIA